MLPLNDMTTLWFLLVILCRTALSANLTNYDTVAELRRHNANAEPIGTTQVQTTSGPFTVTLWANQGELPPYFCEASISTSKCQAQDVWVYIDLHDDSSMSSPETLRPQYTDLSNRLDHLRRINDAISIDDTEATDQSVAIERLRQQLDTLNNDLDTLSPKTDREDIIRLQQQQTALLNRLMHDVANLERDPHIRAKLGKLLDLAAQQKNAETAADTGEERDIAALRDTVERMEQDTLKSAQLIKDASMASIDAMKSHLNHLQRLCAINNANGSHSGINQIQERLHRIEQELESDRSSQALDPMKQQIREVGDQLMEILQRQPHHDRPVSDDVPGSTKARHRIVSSTDRRFGGRGGISGMGDEIVEPETEDDGDDIAVLRDRVSALEQGIALAELNTVKAKYETDIDALKSHLNNLNKLCEMIHGDGSDSSEITAEINGIEEQLDRTRNGMDSIGVSNGGIASFTRYSGELDTMKQRIRGLDEQIMRILQQQHHHNKAALDDAATAAEEGQHAASSTEQRRIAHEAQQQVADLQRRAEGTEQMSEQMQMLQQQALSSQLDNIRDKNKAEIDRLHRNAEHMATIKGSGASDEEIARIATATDQLKQELQDIQRLQEEQIAVLHGELREARGYDKEISSRIEELESAYSAALHGMTNKGVEDDEVLNKLRELQEKHKQEMQRISGTLDGDHSKVRQELQEATGAVDTLTRQIQSLEDAQSRRDEAVASSDKQMRAEIDELQSKLRSEKHLHEQQQQRHDKVVAGHQDQHHKDAQQFHEQFGRQKDAADLQRGRLQETLRGKDESLRDCQQKQQEHQRSQEAKSREYDALSTQSQECIADKKHIAGQYEQLLKYFDSVKEAFTELNQFGDALFARYTMIRAFKEGPAYVTGALPTVKHCTGQVPQQIDSNDYRRFLHCVTEYQKREYPYYPYIETFVLECATLVEHPITAYYVKELFQRRVWMAMMDKTGSATRFSYMVQVTMISDCKDRRNQIQILMCLVCRWMKYKDAIFEIFIDAGVVAARSVSAVSESLQAKNLLDPPNDNARARKWKEECLMFFKHPNRWVK